MSILKWLGPWLFVGILIACSDEQATVNNDSTANIEEAQGNTQIDVDKGVVNVEVALPADFVGGLTEDELKADAKDQGIKDITLNDDGSVIYKIPKSEHAKIMDNMKTELEQSIIDLMASGDYPSIQRVIYNESLTKFTFTVDKAEFKAGFDSFAVFGIIVDAVYYHMFDGKGNEKIDFEYIDATTDDIFKSKTYPDDYGEIQSKE